MFNDLVKDRIKECEDWAGQNGGIISRRIIYDIIKNKNNDITEEEIESVCYFLTEEGISISESDDEGYVSDVNEDPFIPADVNIGVRNISLDAILKRLEYEEIDLYPEFQRRPNLWTIEQKSRLIESLMLMIPLPAFYFDASSEKKWIVIDGLQRLSAIKGYIVDKTYNLTGLQYLKEFEDCSFSDLPRQYVRRITETQLVVYTVEKGTPKNVVFNIFQRLNTGGLALTAQEIRHALNQGEIIPIISQMAACDEFKRATGYSIKTSRMLDCEYATRYIAFTRLDISNYSGNIDEFLNDALVYGNGCSDSERKRILSTFKRDLDYCYRIFDKYAFRRIKADNTRGPINKALFECFLLGISGMDKKDLDKMVSNKTEIQNRYFAFVRSDYANYLKSGDKYTVNRRVQMTREFLEDMRNVTVNVNFRDN